MEGFLWRVVLSAAGMHRVDRDNVHDMAWSFVRLVVCVWGVHTNVCCNPCSVGSVRLPYRVTVDVRGERWVRIGIGIGLCVRPDVRISTCLLCGPGRYRYIYIPDPGDGVPDRTRSSRAATTRWSMRHVTDRTRRAAAATIIERDPIPAARGTCGLRRGHRRGPRRITRRRSRSVISASIGGSRNTHVTTTERSCPTQWVPVRVAGPPRPEPAPPLVRHF